MFVRLYMGLYKHLGWSVKFPETNTCKQLGIKPEREVLKTFF